MRNPRGGRGRVAAAAPLYSLRALDQRLKYNVEGVVVTREVCVGGVLRQRRDAPVPRHVGVEVPRRPRQPPRQRPGPLHYVVVASMSLREPQAYTTSTPRRPPRRVHRVLPDVAKPPERRY
ncbi:hypothetical protein EVAR_89122_1 [Eumeta japonica]|uniref:Uncharacterized protein n=1 Tax=Eumeta variegata TaxID=151549 RepID=A0A4C1ZQN2_EUMVA|nr:hypothetical protein EVAR_89122_1 [Eumeta japonica]